MSKRKQVNCAYCGKENLSRNIIGLNKKLIGTQSERMMCLPCLAEYLEVDTDLLLDKIEEFKNQGCTQF